MHHASHQLALSLTHHLRISSSTRRHSDFTRRRSHTPCSTFNLTRLRSAISCGISPSPGPLITTLTTSSCIFKRRRNHRNHSNLAQIKCVFDLHQTTWTTLIWLCTLSARSIANISALFVDSVYLCNADLFVKSETLLSDNDPVICNAIASPGFELFSCPKIARESESTPLLLFFLHSFIGYDSYNTDMV